MLPKGRAGARTNTVQYLYADREWTMARIGEALNVTTKTVRACSSLNWL
jgi:hypothetical protein